MVKDIKIAENILKSLFPNLKTDKKFRVVSDCNKDFNCIAWAMRLPDRWVDCSKTAGHWWPINLTGTNLDYSPQALIDAFSAMKFVTCTSDTIEPMFDKVVLYKNPYCGNWTHAARVVDTTLCNSKIGALWGIFHGGEADRLLNVSKPGETYGIVYAYMKRPKIYRVYSLWLMVRKVYDVIKSLRM